MIDLDRLRKACDEYQETVGPIGRGLAEILAAAGEIVLDSPVISFCSKHRERADQWCWRGEVRDEACEVDEVAVVPVLEPGEFR
jgi:hypothetical protein